RCPRLPGSWHIGAMTGFRVPWIRGADSRADTITYALLAALLLISAVSNSLSVTDDLARSGSPSVPLEAWIWEVTSMVGLLLALPVVQLAMTYSPVRLTTWRWAVPGHFIAFLVFTCLHILIMVGLRELAYLWLLDWPYDFGLGHLENWIYEARKDAVSYILAALAFAANRQIEQHRLEANAARDQAKSKGQLVLKCGGRTLFIQATEFVRAQAAGNYVDVVTATGTLLARMTLSELDVLLEDAGARHARIHRSHIVSLSHIAETVPTGEGGLTVRLSNGEVIPASRRYRSDLEQAIQQVA
ncbi:MAG: LytTR family DNA-binding domain-containing protein, partial [Pseudomonadota bacterium]